METNQPTQGASTALKWSEMGLVAAIAILIALGWYGFSSADNSLPIFYVNWQSGNDNLTGNSPSEPLKTVGAAIRQLTQEVADDRDAKVVLIGTYPEAINLADLGQIEITGMEGDEISGMDGSEEDVTATINLIRATNVVDLYVHDLDLRPVNPLWTVVWFEVMSDSENRLQFKNNIVGSLEAIRLVNSNEAVNTARMTVEIASNDFELPATASGNARYPLIHDFVDLKPTTQDLQVDFTLENNVFGKHSASRLPIVQLGQASGTAKIVGNQFITTGIGDSLEELIVVGASYLTTGVLADSNQIGFVQP